MFNEISKKAKQIQDDCDNCIMIVSKGNKTVFAVKGGIFDVVDLYRQGFKKDEDFLSITEMSVNAFKDLKRFKKLSDSEKAEKLIESLKDLKKILN